MPTMLNTHSLADFEAIADQAFAALPADIREACKNVVIRIEDFPSGDQLDALEGDDPLHITGLYDGVPLTEKSVLDPAPRPDFVWLFRRPILDEWSERENVTLQELISHVLVHELAHHLGWSDDDIAAIDRWWE